MSAQFRITGPFSGRLVVRMSGVLDEADAEAMSAALQKQVRELKEDLVVLIDLTDLADCTIMARAALIRLQTFLARRVRRTAYLANTSRFRGLALFIVQQAKDENAKPVPTVEAAGEWLGRSNTKGRLEEIKERTWGALRLARAEAQAQATGARR
jgi:hypothetical protein